MEDEIQNQDANPGKEKKPARGSADTERVLVIDDEELIRILTENFLEQLGYKVLLADCGEDAVEIFREKSSQIQLVISDITMPGIDGIETVRQLRQIDPGIRAIISSGYSNERIDSFPEKTVFLPKPYSISELQAAIKAISQ
jgi:two-component system, cell cycle sensor histidine kinase and response regulator CckA